MVSAALTLILCGAQVGSRQLQCMVQIAATSGDLECLLQGTRGYGLATRFQLVRGYLIVSVHVMQYGYSNAAFPIATHLEEHAGKQSRLDRWQFRGLSPPYHRSCLLTALIGVL